MKLSEEIKQRMNENKKQYEQSFNNLLDAQNEEEQAKILNLRSSLNQEWFNLCDEYHKAKIEEEEEDEAINEVETISNIDLNTLSSSEIEEIGQCLYIEFIECTKALNINIEHLKPNDLAYIIIEITNRLKALLN